MAYSLQNTTSLASLADAIRSKTGDSASMTVEEMITAVNSITTGGGSSSGGWIKKKEFYETTQSSSATTIAYGNYLDIDTGLTNDKEWIFLFTTCQRNYNNTHYTHYPRNIWALQYDGSTVWNYAYNGIRDITEASNSTALVSSDNKYIVKFESYTNNSTHTRMIRINNNTTWTDGSFTHTDNINLGQGGYPDNSSGETHYVWGTLFYLDESFNEISNVNFNQLKDVFSSGRNTEVIDAIWDVITFDNILSNDISSGLQYQNSTNSAHNDWSSKEITFYDTTGANLNFANLFQYSTIQKPPKLRTNAGEFTINNITVMFAGSHIIEVPSDFFPSSNVALGNNSGSTNRRGSLFYDCKYLRSVPDDFLADLYYNLTTFSSQIGYQLTYSMYYNCWVIPKILGMGYPSSNTTKFTQNLFTNTFIYCCGLHRLTFYKPNGSVGTMNATNQTIDLRSVGFMQNGALDTSNYSDYIDFTPILITPSNATVANMQNENSFATEKQYATYNRVSAVETINSLPDTTAAGGNNTIIFASGAGSAYGTDYDMDSLSSAEIAVATAKGWTVSIQ